MSTTHRQSPLRAPDASAAPDAPATPPPPPAPEFDGFVQHPDLPVQSDGDRRAFADAVRRLRTGGQSLDLSERTLMVAAGVVAPLGLVFVLLGWYGAARTSNLFEQIPYLISGGLFGLGLVFLGAFFYFAHWLTELVKESRAGSAALLEAIAALQRTIVDGSTAPAPSAANGTPMDGDVLVATARGAMAHRAACPVVAGKSDLRQVSSADALAPCKMCEPYEDEFSG
ncbi:hypothetical protein [Actinospongicola halichondriae]|uniref:hypothetical protein n=1 Tax=Actinospongicola halichondriae TaxID=3236844 RepID=UPI003D4DDA2A